MLLTFVIATLVKIPSVRKTDLVLTVLNTHFVISDLDMVFMGNRPSPVRLAVPVSPGTSRLWTCVNKGAVLLPLRV